MRVRFGTIAALALAALWPGCQDNTGPQGASHKLRVLLTDAPFPYDSVTHVNVYVVRIMASTRPDTGGNASDTLALGLRTIAEPRRAIDMLTLSGGAVDSLAATPIGDTLTYQQLRVVIRTDSSSITLKDGRVLTSVSSPGIQFGGPAEQTYGLFLAAPLTIPDTGATVVVDFNAGRSFRMVDTVPGHGFEFVPFIRAVNSALTGTIGGTVVDSTLTHLADVGLTVFLGDTNSVISTGKTAGDGTFTLPFIEAGTYIVAAAPSPWSACAGAQRTGVVVTAGSVTALGTWMLPGPLAGCH